jgi:hypothetical protein
MRTPKALYPLIATVCLLVGTYSGAGGDAPKSSARKALPWKITGELEESCSCDAACPCWFGNKPTKSMCSGGMAYFITSGKYGSVKLDGLAIAGMAQSPEGKTMMESMGSWNMANLYLDERATPEQRIALEAVAKEMFPPGTPADKMQIRYVPITRKIVGKDHVVTLGTYGSFAGKLIESPGGGSPKIANPLLPEPAHKEYFQGTTSHQVFEDGVKWEFSGTNYMYNKFTVTNVDYEKMAAMMATPKDKDSSH